MAPGAMNRRVNQRGQASSTEFALSPQKMQNRAMAMFCEMLHRQTFKLNVPGRRASPVIIPEDHWWQEYRSRHHGGQPPRLAGSGIGARRIFSEASTARPAVRPTIRLAPLPNGVQLHRADGRKLYRAGSLLRSLEYECAVRLRFDKEDVMEHECIYLIRAGEN